MNSTRLMGRLAWGLAVACALGFGATQAFADPSPPELARRCDNVVCDASCKDKGYVYGFCVNGVCGCFSR